MTIDGLAAMKRSRDEASEKAKKRNSARHATPPRNPAKQKPEPAPAAVVEDAPAAEVVSAPRQKVAKPVVKAVSPAQSAPLAPLVRSTIYLDESANEWLEGIAIDGRRAKPKVDASRSAVVRLAVQRLMESMTPQQVIDELRGRAEQVPEQAIGRKRL